MRRTRIVVPGGTALVFAAMLALADDRAAPDNKPTQEFARLMSAVRDCPPCVVHVEVGGDGAPKHAGTGVLLSDGRVLTAAHLVNEASADQPVRVRFAGVGDGGAKNKVSADKIAWKKHPSADVAILSGVTVPLGVPGAKLADASPKDGAWLCIAGRDMEGGVHVYGGAVSGRDEMGPRLHISVATQSGDSGAPVFGADGRLVGILSGAGRVTRTITTAETVGAQETTVTRMLQVPAAFAVDLVSLNWEDLR